VLEFVGEAFFTAHRGLLHVEIADPWIEFEGDELFLSVSSFDRAHRTRLATLDAAAAAAGEGSVCILKAAITAPGALMLGGVYEEGTELDPVRVPIPVGIFSHTAATSS
jgi:hypothetical protein